MVRVPDVVGNRAVFTIRVWYRALRIIFDVGAILGNSNAQNPVVVGASYCVSPMRFCLLYTSDAADDLLCVDLGGRRFIKKKNKKKKKKPYTLLH